LPRNLLYLQRREHDDHDFRKALRLRVLHSHHRPTLHRRGATMMKPFRILTDDREICVKPNRTYVHVEGADYPVVTFTVRVYPLPRVLWNDHEERFISESVVPDLSALWQLVTAELVGGEEE